MASKVTDRDRGWERLTRELRGAKGLVGKSGVVGPKAAAERKLDDGRTVTNAELAMIHEFGDGVPERSFIRKPFDDNRQKYESRLALYARRVYAGAMKVERAVGLVAAEMSSDVKKYIVNGPGVPPPNAPATIAKKGSSRPLVDTAQMKNAVTWAVVREGDEPSST
jgi:hypothetical protein